MTKKDKVKKPAKPQSAEECNAKQAGKLWNWSDLPSHLASLRKKPAFFVDAVEVLQQIHGLKIDGKLGKKTLQMIRSVWSSSAPSAPAAKPEAAAADDSGDD